VGRWGLPWRVGQGAGWAGWGRVGRVGVGQGRVGTWPTEWGGWNWEEGWRAMVEGFGI
jgi:hypothetical protein